MTQLVHPNLSVVGFPDYCLGYVERVFNIFNDPDADAWTGWTNTQFKHYDPVPKDVSVPVWFSWTGTIGGITKNWGHVAVSTPYGVYTNPLSGSGHVVFPSVSALATAYGVSYVGWSEDLKIRLVQGDTMTEDGVRYGYLAVTRAQPTADQLKYWIGRPSEEFTLALYKLSDNYPLASSSGYVAYTGAQLFVKK